jgi:hypothetical protein
LGLREAARVLRDAGELAPHVRALGHCILALRGVNAARVEAEDAEAEFRRAHERLRAAHDACQRWAVLVARATHDLAVERDQQEKESDPW